MTSYMIDFGLCHISSILGAGVGLTRSLINFPQLTLGKTTFFCILMIPFHKSKNKKACNTDVMVALFAGDYSNIFIIKLLFSS